MGGANIWQKILYKYATALPRYSLFVALIQPMHSRAFSESNFLTSISCIVELLAHAPQTSPVVRRIIITAVCKQFQHNSCSRSMYYSFFSNAPADSASASIQSMNMPATLWQLRSSSSDALTKSNYCHASLSIVFTGLPYGWDSYCLMDMQAS